MAPTRSRTHGSKAWPSFPSSCTPKLVQGEPTISKRLISRMTRSGSLPGWVLHFHQGKASMHDVPGMSTAYVCFKPNCMGQHRKQRCHGGRGCKLTSSSKIALLFFCLSGLLSFPISRLTISFWYSAYITELLCSACQHAHTSREAPCGCSSRTPTQFSCMSCM